MPVQWARPGPFRRAAALHPALAPVVVALGVVGHGLPVVLRAGAAAARPGRRPAAAAHGLRADARRARAARPAAPRRPLRGEPRACAPVERRMVVVALCAGARAVGGQPRACSSCSRSVAAERGLPRDLPPAARGAKPKDALDARALRGRHRPLPRGLRGDPVPRRGAAVASARWLRRDRRPCWRARCSSASSTSTAAGDAAAFTRVPFAIVVGVRLGPAAGAHAARSSPRSWPTRLLNTITFATVVVTGVEMETETPDAALGAAMLVGGAILTAIALRHARPRRTGSGGC